MYILQKQNVSDIELGFDVDAPLMASTTTFGVSSFLVSGRLAGSDERLVFYLGDVMGNCAEDDLLEALRELKFLEGRILLLEERNRELQDRVDELLETEVLS